MNLQTDFALAHSITDVGNRFVACCGRMKEDNVNGVALFDVRCAERINILERGKRDDGRNALPCILCCAWEVLRKMLPLAQTMTTRMILLIIKSNHRSRCGRDARKSGRESSRIEPAMKSIGFSLGNMKVGGKRDDEEEKNTKTSRIYAWEFII